MVGGTTPCFIVKMQTALSTLPAPPSRCPIIDLVALTRSPFRAWSPANNLIALVSQTSPTWVEVGDVCETNAIKLFAVDHARNRLLRSEEHTSELQSRQYIECR